MLRTLNEIVIPNEVIASPLVIPPQPSRSRAGWLLHVQLVALRSSSSCRCPSEHAIEILARWRAHEADLPPLCEQSLCCCLRCALAWLVAVGRDDDLTHQLG